MRNTLLTTLLLFPLIAAAPKVHVDHPGLVRLHWQQAANASSFKEMTTFDMIDLLHEMDFHHIELSPGQTLSPDHKDWKVGVDTAPEAVDALLAKLKSHKMDIVSFGPVDFGTTEAEARKVFEFGKKLKLKTLLSDAAPEQLEMLDTLAQKYQINIALISDTDSGRYKNARDLADAIKGRSKRIGACADRVAWEKSPSYNPLDITRLDDRVLDVHLSDVNAHGNPPALDDKSMLTLLYNQGFKGICCIQDATEDPHARLENFAKSVDTFNEIVRELAKD